MKDYEINLFIEFQQNSGEFLKVLGELSSKVDSGKPVAIQHKDLKNHVSTMELFWDITEKIFLKYEEKLMQLRLQGFNDHCKAVIFQNELKEAYNELFKVRNKIPDVVLRLMKKTAVPTKQDFEVDVPIKTKHHGQKN